MRLSRVVSFAATLAAFAFPAAAAQFGPTSYVQSSDSPFDGQTFDAFHLEDFEDALLNVPGVSASAGAPFAPGGITDSVDEDDGTIDGSGVAGNSFFSGSGATGISFTFDESTLGSLPTHAGVVWTDGSGTISFQAFGPADELLVTIGPFSDAESPNGSFGGETGEDRFFGASNEAGISRIFISNTSGGIEVDHLQFGLNGEFNGEPEPEPNPIPLPAGAIPGLIALGGGLITGRRIRKLLK